MDYQAHVPDDICSLFDVAGIFESLVDGYALNMHHNTYEDDIKHR